MPPATVKTKKLELRRQEILDAGSHLFGTLGYEDTNLDDIVESAAYSKTSIYKLFGNKEGLLSALNEEIVEELLRLLDELDHTKLKVEALLKAYARQALELVLSEKHTAVVKAIITESGRLPNLGINYYHMGPEARQKQLATYLQEQNEAGNLSIDNCQKAAVHFYGLLLWDTMMPQIVGANPQ